MFVRKLDLTKSISWNCENLEENKLLVLPYRVVRERYEERYIFSFIFNLRIWADVYLKELTIITK